MLSHLAKTTQPAGGGARFQTSSSEHILSMTSCNSSASNRCRLPSPQNRALAGAGGWCSHCSGLGGYAVRSVSLGAAIHILDKALKR